MVRVPALGVPEPLVRAEAKHKGAAQPEAGPNLPSDKLGSGTAGADPAVAEQTGEQGVVQIPGRCIVVDPSAPLAGMLAVIEQRFDMRT